MKVYKVPVTIDNTNIEYAFIFVDDDMTSGSYPVQQETGFGFDNADDILYWFDDAMNSSAWRKAPQARYNAATQMGLEYYSALIEQYWAGQTSFERLDPTYHQTTTLATTADIGGVECEIDSTVNVGQSTEYVGILFNSALSYLMMASGTGSTMFFNFNVLSSDAIQNGEIHLTENTKYASLENRIYTGGSDWQLSSYVTSYGTVPSYWITQLNGIKVEPDDDPYSGSDGTGSESTTGGGGGVTDEDNWDPTSDANPIPGLPSLSAADTGFVTLYNPSLYQLRSLASYLWSGAFDINTFKKIMADPMDTILGLNIVPVDVTSAGSRNVTVGNIDTGISMNVASSQYVTVDCGSVDVSEVWHGFLDYNPYTKLSIFLPFIGDHEIDVDIFQGSTMGIVYHVDILSGACVAFITAGGKVVYQFAGQCAVSIPVTSANYTQTILSLGTLVAGGVGIVATGGMSAPVTAANIAGGATAMANTAANVASSKPRFAKSGNVSGGNGIMGTQKPYLFIQRPKICAPAAQNIYTGYPSYITYNLGSISGFTQVQDIHLDGISCTETERKEIMSKLREGVIL